MSPPRTRRRSRRFQPGWMLAGLLLIVPACCPDEFRFPVHPASGQVLYQGEPAANAMVRFHPIDPKIVEIPEGVEGPPVTLAAPTDAEGRFALSTYLADDGVPAGDYKVTVFLDEGEPGGDEADPEETDAANVESATPRPMVLLNALQYQDPGRTPLTATVKEGEDNDFVFELD